MLSLNPLQALDAMSDPDSARESVQTVAEQARGMEDAFAPYVLAPMATHDGRVLRAFTLPQDRSLYDAYPAEFEAAPKPSSEDGFGTTTMLRQTQGRALDLEAMATDFVFHPFAEGAGHEIEALAQHCGYTEACPFNVHWLPTSKQWLLLGGKFIQRQVTLRDGLETFVDKEFTLATTKLPLTRGHIGVNLTLTAGSLNNSATASATYHWISKAEWAVREVTTGGQCTLSPVDEDAFATRAGEMFIAMFAVDSNLARHWNCFFQVPWLGGPYLPTLLATGASGTLLN